jgi:hypothetical protein
MKRRIQRLLNDFAGLELRRVSRKSPEYWPSEKLPDELIRNCKLVVDRFELIRRVAADLPKDLVVTELGVAFGDFSEFLLQALPIEKFYAIDLFVMDELEEIWGRRIKDVFKGKSHLEFFKERFAEDGRVEVLKGFSDQALGTLEDRMFDLIYIDADHSYDGVRKDLLVAADKIKEEGVIVLNDYAHANPNGFHAYGVPKACHEFMLEHRWELIYLGLQPSGLYDVALRRLDSRNFSEI